MPFRSRATSLVVLGLAALFVVGISLPALAAEVDSADIVIITEGDVFRDDLYVAANRVLIRGTIEGDLFALAAQDVRIEGEVTGSVMALAGEVVVVGTVGGSLRVTAPKLAVAGVVEGDVVSSAISTELGENSRVEGDVVIWGWEVSSLGAIHGDLGGSMRRLDIAGEVRGDVEVSVGSLEVVDSLEVGGDLNYRSDTPAVGLENAQVGGAVVQQEPLAPNVRLRALGLASRLVVAILLSAVALLVASAWPGRTERALRGLSEQPVRAVSSGLLVVLSPFLVAGVAALIFVLAPATAALPLVAALLPVLFATLGLVLVLGLFAGVPAVAWIGSRIRRRTTLAGAVGIGAAVVALLWLVPIVGWLVAFAVLVAGLGGWITTLRAPADALEPGISAELPR